MGKSNKSRGSKKSTSKKAGVQHSMKYKRASKIATGRMAKAMVFKGRKEKTSGGLRQDALMKNKRGKIVSKKASANGKVSFRKIEPWLDAVMEAREALHTKGFVAINGKSLHGQALYAKATTLHNARRNRSSI